MPTRPGVSRSDRISQAGLRRLQQQLACGNKISKQVLAQWIRRYGEPAREIIKAHDLYVSEFDEIDTSSC